MFASNRLVGGPSVLISLLLSQPQKVGKASRTKRFARDKGRPPTAIFKSRILDACILVCLQDTDLDAWLCLGQDGVDTTFNLQTGFFGQEQEIGVMNVGCAVEVAKCGELSRDDLGETLQSLTLKAVEIDELVGLGGWGRVDDAFGEVLDGQANGDDGASALVARYMHGSAHTTDDAGAEIDRETCASFEIVCLEERFKETVGEEMLGHAFTGIFDDEVDKVLIWCSRISGGRKGEVLLGAGRGGDRGGERYFDVAFGGEAQGVGDELVGELLDEAGGYNRLPSAQTGVGLQDEFGWWWQSCIVAIFSTNLAHLGIPSLGSYRVEQFAKIDGFIWINLVLFFGLTSMYGFCCKVSKVI